MTLDPRIRLHQGDLTTFAGDVIVNAANNHLVLGAGVAGAIRRRGGPSIQEECDRHGPILVGEAAITGAGDLPCRLVIHAAAMGDEPVTERSLVESTRAAFDLAERHACRSIALPAIGTGIGGFPIARCAALMRRETEAALERARHLEEVHFFLFGDEDFRAFAAAFDAAGPP